MNITLYSDAECTQVYKSGFAGEWSHVLGNTGSSGSSTSNTSVHTVDGTEITFRQLCYFNESTVSSAAQTPTNIELPITNTDTIQTLYFTPKSCLKFHCYKDGTQTDFYCEGFYQDYGQGFVKVTNIPNPHTQSYNNKPIILRFRTSANAFYKTSAGGTEHKYAETGFFGFDVVSVNNQGANVVDRCRYAVAPLEKYIIYDDMPDYKPPKGNHRGGGKGTGYYPNSTIPALPTNAINAAFSAVLGTGNGLTYYKLTGNSLIDITEFLYDCGLTVKFRNSQYRDAIASCILIPYDVTADFSNTLGIVYLANKSIPVSGGCDFITQPLKEIDFGTIDLTAANIGFKSYADYIHTSATLYLPCFGAVNIDMSAIAGGILSLHGVIDVRNGNILYRLETQAEMDDLPVLYGQYNGNCGIAVPVGGANSQIDIMGAVASIGAVGVGAATGNPMGVIGGTAGLISSVAPAPTIDNSGAMQPAAAAMGTPVPVLQIRKHLLSAPPDYKEIYGYPSDATQDGVYLENQKTLGQYSGYFQAAECDVSGIAGATESEKIEIENLLKGGVYL